MIRIMEPNKTDDLDLKLIQELQKSGRASYVELANRLNVVEGTVRKRVKRLLDRDLIKVVAIPNMSKLGYNFTAMMALRVQVADLRRIAKELAQKPNICYLTFATGRYDLLAVVLSQSPEDLSHFIQNEISSLPGILLTETFVNLDVIKGKWPVIETTQLVESIKTISPEKTLG